MAEAAHACIVQTDRDAFAYVTQYLLRCRCHMDSWRTWRPGDPAVRCPESGADLTEGLGE